MTTLKHLPRTLLQPSATNPRKHFDPARQAELRASIEQHGVLQPLIVRGIEGRDGSDGQPLYEIISGERRWRASVGTQAADALPCNVGHYDDLQVLQIQLIENVQRADLHPLEEAEGYGRLQQAHQPIEDIAAAVGMSKPHVYARLRLLGLTPDARNAFFTGRFGIASALQIARLNTQHQAEICLAIERDAAKASPWTADAIAHHIRTRYTLRLAGAPFSLHDAALLPAAGACAACPKRSGANPELFDDITEADTCTDRKCFADKATAHVAAAVGAAQARGGTVLHGKEAERLLPTPDATVKGFLRLDRPSEFALSNKPLRELVPADDREVTLIVRTMANDTPPVLVEVMPTPYVRKLLADKGLLKPDDHAEPAAKPKRETAKVPARETKVQPSAAVSPADATLDDDPELVESLRKLEVIPGYVMRDKRLPTPRDQARYVNSATAQARSTIALNRIARRLRTDQAEGFPSEGLNRLLALQMWYGAGGNTESLLRQLGFEVSAKVNAMAGLEEFLRGIDEAQAATIALLLLAAQEGSADDAVFDPTLAVAECIGASLEGVDAAAKALVEERLRLQLLKLAPPAPKAKATTTKSKSPASGSAKKPAAKPTTPTKYRNAETGETWSGRGLQPKWLKVALESGRKLADFDVAALAAATKVKLSPEAAWPFPTSGGPDSGPVKITAPLLAAARQHVIETRKADALGLMAALRVSGAMASRLLMELHTQRVLELRLDGAFDVIVAAEGASA
jgi:ParB/RepB/Spo0J family partition protein